MSYPLGVHVTCTKQPLKVQRKEQSFHGSHTRISNQLMSHLECDNMFWDGVGGVDPKEINGAKLTMYYSITSLKDVAPHQSNYKRSIWTK